MDHDISFVWRLKKLIVKAMKKDFHRRQVLK